MKSISTGNQKVEAGWLFQTVFVYNFMFTLNKNRHWFHKNKSTMYLSIMADTKFESVVGIV